MSNYEKQLLGNRRLGTVTAVAADPTLTLTFDGADEERRTHCSIAVEFYSESTGTTVVAPTAGTLTYSWTEWTLPGASLTPDNQGSLSSGVINLASGTNRPVDFVAPGHVKTVSVALSSISGNGVTHARLKFVSNLA